MERQLSSTSEESSGMPSPRETDSMVGDWSDSSEQENEASPIRQPSVENARNYKEAQQAARDKFAWLVHAAPVAASRRPSPDKRVSSNGSTLVDRRRGVGVQGSTLEYDPEEGKPCNDPQPREVAACVDSGFSNKAAEQYLSACARYSLTPNGGSLLCLSMGLAMLEADETLTNLALVPLCAALLDAPFVKHLKLSGHPVNDTGAAVLALVLPGCPWIKELELERCGLSGVGLQSLCHAISKSGVRRLILRRNLLRQNAKEANAALAHLVLVAKRLETLDLQSCGLQSIGMREIKKAVATREERGMPPIVVAYEGNFVLVEVMNSLTHGACALVCVEAWRRLHGLIVQMCHTESVFALTFYIVSMLLMFTGSTLFHSTFSLTNLAWLFLIVDHCAIYFLIAGTYTAVLIMGCRDEETLEVDMGAHIHVGVYWACVVIGVVMETIHSPQKTVWYTRWKFLLLMYVGLGFGGIPYITSCSLVKKAGVMPLLEVGGLTYVIGIVFFLLDKKYPSMHVIWHIFVGAASFVHFAAVWNLTQTVIALTSGHHSCRKMQEEPLSGLANLIS